MCGIVGYIGPREVPALLIDGLKRLEYRGYDSCGIAVLENGGARVLRSVGRIEGLEKKLLALPDFHPGATCGIGHTRWATHGRPTEDNAHPHCDCSGRFMVAHNGIIENYMDLKKRLTAEGHCFRTQTDTEVLPHLIESHFQGNLEEAVRTALREIEGIYGLVAISPNDGMKIVAARKGAPLVLGMGEGENFIASDAPALLPYTRKMVFLEDSEVAVIGLNAVEVRDGGGRSVSRPVQRITWTAEMAEKEGYPHFMLKEIYEQPRAVRDTLRGRINAQNDVILQAEVDAEALRRIEQVKVVACGTSLHAGLVGKFMIESLARVPVEVDYASEFRYRDPLVGTRDLTIAISQSGETADTLAALQEAKGKGAHVLSLVNVVGSMCARLSDGVIYTHAGPEIGVASTKAFTTQLAALGLVALYTAQVRGSLTIEEVRRRAALLREIPQLTERLLEQNAHLQKLAEKFAGYGNFLYLGRGLNYPIALEGALKLKEISYIHAEGYTAGEMKHGPIALIDSDMPVVVIAPQDAVYRKTMANIEEVKVRNGIVIAVATEGDTAIAEKADEVIYVPETDPLLYPLLTVVPLQMFAYHVAVLRGCDVDKPRNLAKSVTVE